MAIDQQIIELVTSAAQNSERAANTVDQVLTEIKESGGQGADVTVAVSEHNNAPDAHANFRKYKGATATKPGVAGLVPPAAAGTDNRFLSPYGDWQNGTTREVLTAGKTLYVRTDGNDNNDGSADDAAHAFRTLRYAIDYIHKKYISTIYDGVKIHLGEGEFSGAFGINSPSNTRNKILQIQGAGSNKTSIVSTDITCIQAFFGQISLSELNIKFTQNNSENSAIEIYPFSHLTLSECSIEIDGNYGGTLEMIRCRGNLYITGTNTIKNVRYQGSTVFCRLMNRGVLSFYGQFSASGRYAPFVWLSGASTAEIAATFSGDATGKRYTCAVNSCINTAGKGPDYLPGSEAGTVDETSHYL